LKHKEIVGVVGMGKGSEDGVEGVGIFKIFGGFLGDN